MGKETQNLFWHHSPATHLHLIQHLQAWSIFRFIKLEDDVTNLWLQLQEQFEGTTDKHGSDQTLKPTTSHPTASSLQSARSQTGSSGHSKNWLPNRPQSPCAGGLGAWKTEMWHQSCGKRSQNNFVKLSSRSGINSEWSYTTKKQRPHLCVHSTVC